MIMLSPRFRGAVLSRLPEEATVVATIACRHYGVTAMHHFEEALDKGQEKVWFEPKGYFRVSKVRASYN